MSYDDESDEEKEASVPISDNDLIEQTRENAFTCLGDGYVSAALFASFMLDVIELGDRLQKLLKESV